MLRVWICRISKRPAGSGIAISISRSNRPNRRSAGSIEFGRFVAAITTTFDRAFIPSINVNNCDTTRRSTSPFVLSLFGAIESISSIKIIAGLFFSASENAFRKFDSDSPAIFDMISGPLIKKKNAPVSFATARAINVFPVPGGPNIKIPLGGLIPIDLNSCGCLNGSSTNSLIFAICLRHPPILSYPTSDNACSSSSRDTGSPSVWISVSGATITYSSGSVSTTLNSTALIPPRTKNVSPLRTGLYASKKYGFKYTSNKSPVIPSTVSSIGNTKIRLPYFTSDIAWIDTKSPNLTRRFFLTTLLILILLSSHSSSERTTNTVSFLTLPLINIVSPLNNPNLSMVAGDKTAVELSSSTDSSTSSLFGADFLRNIAVAMSSASFVSSNLIAESSNSFGFVSSFPIFLNPFPFAYLF
ncbi:hypothetical protein AX774_g3613 [Zancudomyces culisetae]|uniref:Uncharacterized protein n=1 Tax=Zancudomyces culisetae TaxID=1213189 RepID=A0A1R1PPL3_ZANCU|nr:hypothetical protein AX774_g3613 [Zancudomyces culisetae]|eukprot:OMH82898.1 hypothetical protein AX774_g3613 [Zancudomyces culisetae]